MSERVKTSLAAWCQEAMNCNDYDKPCDRMALMHLSIGGTETEVRVIKIGNGKAWTPETLGNFFWNTAQTYCQDLPNAHNFRLIAFFGEAEPRLRHPFMLAGQYDNHGLGTEPPSPEGMRMQNMRHSEAMITGLFNERMAVLEMPLRTIRAMSDYQAMLMKDLHDTRQENADFVRVMKEVLFEEASKRSQHDLEIKKFERDSKDREMLMKLIPVGINELTGREIVPQNTADSLLIEMLAEGIDEKGIQKIMESGAIPPEVMGILMSRFRKAIEAKQQRHEEALARGSEADADATTVTPKLTEGKSNGHQ